ncbi:MAG: hypothetical protein QXJ55_09305 [Candidatus Caldarchaeum sp.]
MAGKLARKVGMALFAYGLTYAVIRIATWLVYTDVPVFRIVPWLPGWVNFLIIWNLPGIAMALLVLVGKPERRYVLAGVAILMSAALWNGYVAVEPFAIPPETYIQTAAQYGFENCGVFQTVPGENIINYNWTVKAGKWCTFYILRPEPRNQYILRIKDGWSNAHVIREQSATGVFYFDHRIMPVGMTFLGLLKQKELTSTWMHYSINNDYRSGNDFVAFGRTWRDDFVFWFMSRPADNMTSTLQVRLYVVIEARR